MQAFRMPGFASAVLCALLCAGNAAGQLLGVDEPVPSPDGDTAFVGSVDVTFEKLSTAERGKIYYTTNGTTPSAYYGTEYDYTEPVVITAKTTLKAVRIRGVQSSRVHTAYFAKRKLPSPIISFEGTLSFAGTKKVTVAMPSGITPAPSSAPKILYSTDASEPDSQVPSAGLTIAKTCVLKVSATHADWDVSPTATASFTLLQPLDKPTVTPAGSTFQSKSLTVSFTHKSKTAFFQWSIGADSKPDTGKIGTSAVVEGNVPGEVIVLKVIAKQTEPPMANSPVVEERYTYRPLPEPPAATPSATSFYDVQTVELASPTAGAEIHYTLDGLAQPTLNTPLYSPERKITFDSTVTLKAAAYRDSVWSNTFIGTYTLKLTSPVASHPSQEFVDSLDVSLSVKSPSAKIVYTLDGNEPTKTSTLLGRGEVIQIRKDTTILKAMAVKGSVTSQVATYQFLRRTEIKTTAAPIVEPAGRDFVDKDTITLRAEAGAAISYSLNGGAYAPYGGPIIVSATTVLRATAKKPDLEASAARTETYVLIPSPPVPSLPGGKYPNRVEVSLAPRTPGSQILYSLAAGNFVPELAEPYEKPLVFSAGTNAISQTVQAVAVLGSNEFKRMSAVVTLIYSVYPNNPSDTLLPNQQRDLTMGIKLANTGSAPVVARLGGFDQLGLTGFKDPTFTVTLSAAAVQPPPTVSFVRTAGQPQAVYRMVSGRPQYVGDGVALEVGPPTVYFAAVDTQAPALALEDQAPTAGDSTRVVLSVVDNVLNPACTLTGSGLPESSAPLTPDANGKLVFHLRDASGNMQELWFKALVSDAVNQARFPASGEKFSALQRLGNLNTPSHWRLGNRKQPYDMVGFPIGRSSRLTWQQVKRKNPDPTLTAYVYRERKHVQLKDTSVLEPGMAFWLGSRDSLLTSLQLPDFYTSGSDPDGRFRVHLKRGWNLVTNPSLQLMHWPVRHGDPFYSTFRVRGLWSYNLDSSDCVAVDSLIPWRGYWAYNAGPVDTVVELLTSAPLAKSSAGPDPGRMEILLDFGRPMTLRLGAAAYARDGLGMEDEPVLPDWAPPGAGPMRRNGWLSRDGDRLMTDLLRFSGEVLRWQVVLEGTPEAGRDSLVKVKGSMLPAGYEAWAWSCRRNLKVRLVEGAAYSVPGAERDTLLIMAGPAAKLAQLPELAQAVETVEAFSSRPAAGRNGASLLLALPGDALVTAELWSVSGRRLARIYSGRLGMGHHALAIPNPEAHRQLAILRLTAQAPTWRENRVHRISW